MFKSRLCKRTITIEFLNLANSISPHKAIASFKHRWCALRYWDGKWHYSSRNNFFLSSPSRNGTLRSFRQKITFPLLRRWEEEQYKASMSATHVESMNPRNACWASHIMKNLSWIYRFSLFLGWREWMPKEWTLYEHFMSHR